MRLSAYSVSLDIGADIWLTSNHRPSWFEKATKIKQIRELAGWRARLAQTKGELPAGRPAWSKQRPCELLVEVAYPHTRRADPANAYPTVKAILDGFTDAGVWADDNSEVIPVVKFMRDDEITERPWHRITIQIRDAGKAAGFYDDVPNGGTITPDTRLGNTHANQ